MSRRPRIKASARVTALFLAALGPACWGAAGAAATETAVQTRDGAEADAVSVREGGGRQAGCLMLAEPLPDGMRRVFFVAKDPSGAWRVDRASGETRQELARRAAKADAVAKARELARLFCPSRLIVRDANGGFESEVVFEGPNGPGPVAQGG